jgi:hypothetical protein
MQDEWNNLYWVGEFTNLSDAIPDINEWLEIYKVSINELNEYPSTFGMCFDTEIETPNEETVMVRGFILEEEQ